MIAPGPTSLRLPRELLRWIDKVAEERRWSRTQTLQYVIERGREALEKEKE